MIFIHVIHRIRKLATLKHSCVSANFALKCFCKYAETLLCSIYTHIYFYKNTCIRATIITNKFFITVFSGCIIGCYKAVYIRNKPINKLSVKEIRATNTHPAQFYLCSNYHYPCTSNILWQEIKKFHSTSSKKHQGYVYEKCISEKNVYYK